MDKTGGNLCYKPDRICKLIVSTAILHNFCMNHGLSIEYDNSDLEIPVELAETNSIDNETRNNRKLFQLMLNIISAHVIVYMYDYYVQ